MKRKKKSVIRLILSGVLLSILLIVVTGGTFAALEVYKYKDVAEEKFASITEANCDHTANTVIYSADDDVISEMNEIIYDYVPISEMSKYVYNGYIAVEDQNFYEHHGIDYKAVLRAAIAYIKNKGEVTQGGSTITQQVLKNGVLTNQRTFERKFTELFLAPMFEDTHSKDEIMEYYVNMNFYGHNCYGIEGASQYYFGKPAKDLSLAEAAALVGMSKGPSLYNPMTNMEGVKNRQMYSLRRMEEEGFITGEERYLAGLEELNFVYERPELPSENYMTSFAIYSAAINLMEKDGFEFKYVF